MLNHSQTPHNSVLTIPLRAAGPLVLQDLPPELAARQAGRTLAGPPAPNTWLVALQAEEGQGGRGTGERAEPSTAPPPMPCVVPGGMRVHGGMRMNLPAECAAPCFAKNALPRQQACRRRLALVLKHARA